MTGASQTRSPRMTPMRAWVDHHAFTALSSLGRMWKRPITHLLTVVVIAIALALPAGFLSGLKMLADLVEPLNVASDISVFMEPQVTVEQVTLAESTIADWPEVAGVRVIDPEQALAEFQVHYALGEALGDLPENPLPYTLVVSPKESAQTQAGTAALADRMQQIPGVELARVDLQWLARFNAILDSSWRVVLVIATLLVLGVVLIVGNTIRLAVENRREEIAVTKQLGATSGFVRRPFLYEGFWFGLLGGLLGWLMLVVAAAFIWPALGQLAQLYSVVPENTYSMGLLLLVLPVFGAMIGLLGAGIVVGHQLRRIQPR